MENKLEHFLNIIHMDINFQEKFKDVFLKKVVVSKKNDYIAIFLSTNEMISLENYIELVKEWIEFYNTTRIKGKKVKKKKGYNKNDK
mgnify:CR=1 FL=1